ncbi:hypothetical protein E1301_Tti020387 [Triplophysa tibetana]|uniref:Uncharacterized protein n=1 Tax=Triplophysa tibetana TaxID=1572043 RepID=A0A5A9PFL1_9TELE|nr:hypothetical protein E1301_Tti020387 [Triplophysa tibetana]
MVAGCVSSGKATPLPDLAKRFCHVIERERESEAQQGVGSKNGWTNYCPRSDDDGNDDTAVRHVYIFSQLILMTSYVISALMSDVEERAAIDNESNQTICMVNVEKRETHRISAVKEKAAFIRTLETLHEEVHVTELCTDAHLQISVPLQ